MRGYYAQSGCVASKLNPVASGKLVTPSRRRAPWVQPPARPLRSPMRNVAAAR